MEHPTKPKKYKVKKEDFNSDKLGLEVRQILSKISKYGGLTNIESVDVEEAPKRGVLVTIRPNKSDKQPKIKPAPKPKHI